MDRRRLLLICESALCVLTAAVLSAAAVRICIDGLALKAADPLSPVFTRAKALKALLPAVPLLAISAILAVTGLIKGIRDEDILRPGRIESAPGQSSMTGIIRIVILVLALIFIAAGIYNGSAADVFGKAVNICTECIGLG